MAPVFLFLCIIFLYVVMERHKSIDLQDYGSADIEAASIEGEKLVRERGAGSGEQGFFLQIF
jgi:hypothetical protein